MTTQETTPGLDRYAQIGDLAIRVQMLLKRISTPALLLLSCEVVLLFYLGNPGAFAFILMAVSTVIALGVWQSLGMGLPIMPLLVLQTFFVYGLPIATGHDILKAYPEDFLLASGIELVVFNFSLAAAWRLGIQLFPPARPISFSLPDFQEDGGGRLKRLGLVLVVCGVLYQILDKLDLLSIFFALLPDGTSSLIYPLIVGMNSCGFFLLSLFVGSGEVRAQEQAAYWGLLALSCLISTSGLLLSGVTTIAVAVFVGLFWSKGRIPWRYLTVVVLALAFLNLGKFTMRGRYWSYNGEPVQPPGGLVGMAGIYAEWAEASFDALAHPTGDDNVSGSAIGTNKESTTHQSLLERVNNLQNLLFIINAIEAQHLSPLEGASYSLIVPLLVPRIMWPNKPRSHQGQVLLNVHFGRQDLNSTYKTYVAWGLIPEAYGNFGAITGSLLLGGGLGLLFAWIEAYTARKLLLSLEGFVSFVFILGMANSFEMVASVLITTIFQSIVPIVLVCMPFLRRAHITRPADSHA